MTIKVGDRAPDFVLKDNRNKEARLSGLGGKRVLLSWHPLAWTGVCADQMKALEASKDLLAGLNTVALGISVDSVPSKNAWAKELKIAETRLLSDFWPHGETASKYGVLRSDGTTERAIFIIDKKGAIRYIDVHDINKRPPLESIVGELEKLNK